MHNVCRVDDLHFKLHHNVINAAANLHLLPHDSIVSFIDAHHVVRVNRLSVCNTINNDPSSLFLGHKSLVSHTSLITRHDQVIPCHPRTDDSSFNSRGHLNDIHHPIMYMDIPTDDLSS